jgi:hypothetical protein
MTDGVDVVLGTFITFRQEPPPRSGKTGRWSVRSSQDSTVVLGGVGWYAPWRRYCFFPTPGTCLEQVCLREVADFVEARTSEHKKRSA